MMGLGFIWMLLFWGGLIVLAIWLIGALFPSSSGQERNDNLAPTTAQSILKARYARGELTAEEYQGMLNDIQQEQF